MRLAVLGLGGAGCRLADRLRRHPAADRAVDIAFAFDTDPDALEALSVVPEDHRHRFGTAPGGLDGDLQAGFDMGTHHVEELRRVVDGADLTGVEALLVTVGFGGATGGGTAPALVAALAELTDRPTYVAGTLPTRGETEAPDGVPPDRPLAERNAARTLDRLDGSADAVLPFDNEAWLRSGETLADARSRLNDAFATRLARLFAAGAPDGRGHVDRPVDATDFAGALGDGTTFAALGYAELEVETDDSAGLLGKLGFGDDEPDVDTSEAVSAIETVIHKSVRGKLTLDCDRDAVERALLAVGGPPAWLNRRAIADGHSWLQSEIGSGSVWGGAAPAADGDVVYAVALLADVRGASRLAELRRMD